VTADWWTEKAESIDTWQGPITSAKSTYSAFKSGLQASAFKSPKPEQGENEAKLG